MDRLKMCVEATKDVSTLLEILVYGELAGTIGASVLFQPFSRFWNVLLAGPSRRGKEVSTPLEILVGGVSPAKSEGVLQWRFNPS